MKSLILPFLNKGMTRAIFIQSGKSPVCNEKLKICSSGITRYGITFLTRHISISS